MDGIKDEFSAVEFAYWEAGMHPAWKRVWSGGVDVTDDFDAWPALWRY